MAEYIEREALIKRLEVTPLFNPQYVYDELVRKGIIDLVKQQPAADVVEVVRCKDCKHYKLRNQSERWNSKTRCCLRSAAIPTKENGFCSYGARKDGSE